MSAILLVILIALDVVLLGVVYFIGKQRLNPGELILELTEERKLLAELRRSVKEEIDFQAQKGRQIIDRVTTLGTEIEMEVKSGTEALTSEVDRVLAEVQLRIDEPLQVLARKQAGLETLLKKVEKERQILSRGIVRSEQLVKFFDKRLPYQEVLDDIEDKKYTDARHLLAQGVAPKQVARELGIAESEVNIMSGLTSGHR